MKNLPFFKHFFPDTRPWEAHRGLWVNLVSEKVESKKEFEEEVERGAKSPERESED